MAIHSAWPPTGSGHNLGLPAHRCSRTTPQSGTVRRRRPARCTADQGTYLPRIGWVGQVPVGSWSALECGGSAVPPTVGANQSTGRPSASATNHRRSPHIPLLSHPLMLARKHSHPPSFQNQRMATQPAQLLTQPLPEPTSPSRFPG